MSVLDARCRDRDRVRVRGRARGGGRISSWVRESLHAHVLDALAAGEVAEGA